MIGSNVFGQAQAAQQQAARTYGGMTQFQPRPMTAAQAGPTAIYGGATIQPTAAPQAATVGPATTMQAAQLGPVERMQGVGAVQAAQAPGMIDVSQLATTNLGAYMSPYTQNVIEAGQADIERQRQLASENLAAQAQRAGAFGGSRQAVQEGVLAGEALRQAGALSAQQRQQAFQQALQAGQFDIGQMQQARTMAAQQQFQAEQLGQQAREAAAAREQAARAGNMQAANQFATQQAQLEQAARQANMQAQNQAQQLQAQFEQQANVAAAAQEAARASQQAGLTQSAMLTSAGALNTAAQQQAAREQAARQSTYQGQFQGANIRQAGASGLTGLGSQMFGQGMQGIAAQQQAAALAQQQQQQMLDAARQQTLANLGYPGQALQTGTSILGGLPRAGVTQAGSPGLFGILSGFGSIF
jgi:hypothetical protein